MRIFGSVARTTTPRLASQLDERVLARWFAQFGRDPTGEQMQRLVSMPEFGAIYLEMRQEGERWRQLAMEAMTGRLLDPSVAPATSRHAILGAACRLLGIDINPINSAPTSNTPSEIAHAPIAVAAWLQTFERDRQLKVPRPIMHVDYAPAIPEEARLWDMACVLARYIKDYPMYRNGLADTIFRPNPREERSLTPLLHAFVRGLFNAGYECPPWLGCRCIATILEMNRVPEQLLPAATQPIATGALQAEVTRQQRRAGTSPLTPPAYRRQTGALGPTPASQSTPPHGLRWQQWREEQERRNARQLHDLTPPPDDK